jgi:hypothetical protein
VDPTSLRRRELLELSGYAALSLRVLPWMGAGCAAEETAPPDSLAVTSSRDSKLGRWAAHSHVLYVPRQLFREPPEEGVTLATTRKYLHSHVVVLTHEQLITVARGDAVRVRDTNGTHAFAIELG